MRRIWICERIIKVYEKERFEQLKRDDSRSQGKSPFNKLIEKDVKDCEGIILSVCEGRFPSRVLVNNFFYSCHPNSAVV